MYWFESSWRCHYPLELSGRIILVPSHYFKLDYETSITYLPRVEKVEAAWVLAVERWVMTRKENQYLLYADMVEWQTRGA